MVIQRHAVSNHSGFPLAFGIAAESVTGADGILRLSERLGRPIR